MPSKGNNRVYSPYVGNTAASSSTTMIVPSLSPPSEKDDDDEDEAKEMVEKEPHSYSQSDMKQRQQYDYNDLQQPSECHPKRLYDHHANIETPTTIPFSPAFTSSDSSYFPTHARSADSAPLPRFTSATSSTSSESYSSAAAISPKKRAKRWIMATLMVIVGILIALTFILIGLGKAFSYHNDQQKQNQPQVITVTTMLASSSAHPPTASTIIPTASSHHSTTTVLVVPTTITTIFSSQAPLLHV